MSKVHQGNLPPTYRSMVKVIQRSRMYTTCLMVIHPYAKIWYAYVKEQRRSCQTQMHGENIILKLRSKVKVIQKS